MPAPHLGAIGGLRHLDDPGLELGDARGALLERRLVVLVRLDDRAVVITGRYAEVLGSRRYHRLRRLVARRRSLTCDLRLRGRAIVPVTHEKARLSPQAGKGKARTQRFG